MAIEKNKRYYEWDLFIAYFCKREDDVYNNESQSDAQRLYKKLTEKTKGKYKIYFYPACGAEACGQFGDNGETRGTPDIICEGSKAFLLVGNGNIQFTKGEWINVTGRSLGAEIMATKDNRFMAYVRQNYSDSTSAATTFSFDGYFNAGSITDNDDNKLLGGIECFTPKDGESMDAMVDKVIAWLDGIIDLYKEFQCSDKLVIDGVPVADRHIYWVGTRWSDIAHCGDLFTGAICLFGVNDDKQNRYAYCAEKDNRIDHNEINVDADLYIFEKVCEVANKDQQAYFYCYNQGLVYGTKDDDGESLYVKAKLKDGTPLLDRFICLADQRLVEKYASKENFRQLCEETGGMARTLPCRRIKKEECQYANLINLFGDEIAKMKKAKAASKKGDDLAAEQDDSNVELENEKFGEEDICPRFVIQAPHGSGGVTTFILSGDMKSELKVGQMLKQDEQYICTIYQEDNVPVNVHAVIFKNANDSRHPMIWLSAPSIQLLHETGKRLFYRGADYQECRNIPFPLRNEFLRQVRSVCEALYREGYYGVCGIDGIICNARQKEAQEHPAEHVYLMEVNTRFQASTGLLNRALVEKGWPSMQHLNIHAFYTAPSVLYCRDLCEPTDVNLLDEGRPFANLEVNFANYSYIYSLNRKQAFHLLQYFADSPYGKERRKQNYIVAYELDGLQVKYIERQSKQLESFEENAYLYRIVFSSNICWVNYSSRLYVNENILDEDVQTYSSILEYRNTPDVREERMLRTKVALLIQGVNIADDVRNVRPGTFQSVDIVFADTQRYGNYVVNSPVVNPHNADEANKGIKYTGLTPFSIETDKDKSDILVLKYYHHILDVIRLLPEDELQETIVDETHRDEKGKPIVVKYADIAYLSTDRLRVHLTNKCKYKMEGKGCKFCGISPGKCDDAVIFTPENIRTVVSTYVERYGNQSFPINEDHSFRQLRHYLLGGQTANLDDDAMVDRMLDTIQIIAETAGASTTEIYAMIVPCSAGALVAMKRKGLTHVAFNLEIWDDEIGEAIMPGKRGEYVSSTGKKRDREAYLKALNVARRIMVSHESVRSMLMVGLEPMENTLEGVRALLRIDVQPMLSIFRPMPGTEFYNYMSPQIVDVVELYHKADKLCKSKRYRTPDGYIDDRIVMHLGPDCTCCQNNTVALPYKESEQRRKQ